MLEALRDTLDQLAGADQVTDQVNGMQHPGFRVRLQAVENVLQIPFLIAGSQGEHQTDPRLGTR